MRKHILAVSGFIGNATLNALDLTMDSLHFPLWLLPGLWMAFGVMLMYEYGPTVRTWFRRSRKIKKERFSFTELRAAYDKLPKQDIGNGIKIATLPDSTNIVRRKDGRLGLALPVRLSVRFKAGSPSMHATVEGQFVDPEPARLERSFGGRESDSS